MLWWHSTHIWFSLALNHGFISLKVMNEKSHVKVTVRATANALSVATSLIWFFMFRSQWIRSTNMTKPTSLEMKWMCKSECICTQFSHKHKDAKHKTVSNRQIIYRHTNNWMTEKPLDRPKWTSESLFKYVWFRNKYIYKSIFFASKENEIPGRKREREWETD